MTIISNKFFWKIGLMAIALVGYGCVAKKEGIRFETQLVAKCQDADPETKHVLFESAKEAIERRNFRLYITTYWNAQGRAVRSNPAESYVQVKGNRWEGMRGPYTLGQLKPLKGVAGDTISDYTVTTEKNGSIVCKLTSPRRVYEWTLVISPKDGNLVKGTRLAPGWGEVIGIDGYLFGFGM